MMDALPPRARNIHSHMWVLGAFAIPAGLVLLIYVPSSGWIGQSLLALVGVHVIGAVVLGSSLYLVAVRRLFRARMGTRRTRRGDALDFGWGPGWMNGLAIAALVSGCGAVTLEIASPSAWPFAFALVALTFLFAAGNLVMQGFRRRDQVFLPMVALLAGDDDLVLDAGCGTGRTTIALGRGPTFGRIIAVDRFDAGYIDDGGRALLERNLAIAGLAHRVEIAPGDLTALNFADNTFDAAVSTHVFDHLGAHKARGLSEMHRVLKSDGRFLMAVWVPSWAMFAVGNVLSLLMTGKAAWRKLAADAGFSILEEGVFNNTWFLLLSKSALI